MDNQNIGNDSKFAFRDYTELLDILLKRKQINKRVNISLLRKLIGKCTFAKQKLLINVLLHIKSYRQMYFCKANVIDKCTFAKQTLLINVLLQSKSYC